MPSFLELVVIGVVGTVLFGHKFATLGRSLGRCLGAFHEGLSEGHSELASHEAAAARPKSLPYTPPESQAPPS